MKFRVYNRKENRYLTIQELGDLYISHNGLLAIHKPDGLFLIEDINYPEKLNKEDYIIEYIDFYDDYRE